MLVQQLHRDDVDGLFQGFPKRHGAGKAVAEIARAPDVAGGRVYPFERLVHHHGGRTQAAVDGGRVNERLDGGTRQAHGLRGAVEVVVVAPADHGFDVAVARVDGHQGRLRLIQAVGVFHRGSCQQPVGVREGSLHGFLGGALHVQIQGRVHVDAAGVDRIDVDTVQFQKLTDDIVHEVGRQVAGGAGIGHDDGFGPGRRRLGRRDHPQLFHPEQHRVAPAPGRLRISVRRMQAGVLGQTGHQGRFRQSELVDGLVEVVAGRGFNAVDAGPQINFIEIRF